MQPDSLPSQNYPNKKNYLQSVTDQKSLQYKNATECWSCVNVWSFPFKVSTSTVSYCYSDWTHTIAILGRKYASSHHRTFSTQKTGTKDQSSLQIKDFSINCHKTLWWFYVTFLLSPFMPLNNLPHQLKHRTTGPVSLTWVLRICWIRTNLEIHEHSMLYKLSTKHQETLFVIKMDKKKGHHLKEAPGYGHTTTWYKFWQHFRAFIFLSFIYQFRKDPFCLIILYILFYFLHVYTAPGQEETTLGDNCFDGSKKISSLWSLVACCKTCPDSSVGRVSAPRNGRSWVRSRAATYQSRKKWY